MARQTKPAKIDYSELPITLDRILSRSTPKRHFDFSLKDAKVNRAFIEIIDEGGEKIEIRDLSIAYLALVAAGKIDAVKELQRTFRMNVNFKSHPLARESALSGYYIETQDISARAQKFDVFNPHDIISTFAYIESLSGVPPDSKVHDFILSLIPDLDIGPTHLATRAESYLKYMIKTGNSPDAATIQKIYSAVSTTTPNETLRRVSRLYEITGISPEFDGQSVSVQEYATQISWLMKEAAYQNLGENDFWLLNFYAREDYAQRHPARVVELLGVEMQDNLSYRAIERTVFLLRLAAKINHSIPPQISNEIPRYFIAAGLGVANDSSGSYELSRLTNCFELCVQNGIYSQQTADYGQAIRDGAKFIEEKVNSGEWVTDFGTGWDNYQNRAIISRKIELLRIIAESSGILSDEEFSMLDKAENAVIRAYDIKTAKT